MPLNQPTAEIAEKLKKLPAKPGCYVYRDEKGAVLYVGKAISLKSRVRSYFQGSTRHSNRIARMVHKVRDMEWIVVDSELEALVLECNLIKEHRPPYNVRLRDDKSYPYIVITKEKFPRVLFTRRVRKDGSKYFGPYTSAWQVRETLQLLHKAFPLIPCGKSWTGKETQRPCLYFHIGQCLAPCAGLADPKAYTEVIQNVSTFLSGKEESLIQKLRGQMEKAAEELEFEMAAKLRDTIASLESVLQRQKVLSTDGLDQDVVAVVKDDRGAAVQMLYIRNGKLIGQRQFFLDGSGSASPGEAVQEFVKQYYADAPDVPREVLLPVEIEERAIVQQWLRQKRGSAVNVEVPQGGERMRLVDLAAQNAEQALNTFAEEIEQKETWAENALSQLQEALELPSRPMRIEGYDISNIQGMAPVGSMVVAENAQAAKDEYRRFKVRYHPESPNDFAMMHEVLTRRLLALLNEDPKFDKRPDLIMIDGGRGQLAAALKARDEMGLDIPMVGLAKRLELLIVPHELGPDDPGYDPSKSAPVERFAVPGSSPDAPFADLPPGPPSNPASQIWRGGEGAADGPTPPPTPSSSLREKEGAFGDDTMAAPASQRERDEWYAYPRHGTKQYRYTDVELPLASPGLMLLRRLRDEAHRFALSYHRKLRDKRMSGSLLEEIPGVGPRRRRLLLRTFGSIDAIRRATVEELASVPTMTETMAKKVKDYMAEG